MTQTDAKMSHMNATQWATLVLLSILWGGSFFFYKVLASALPPFTLVLGRVIIAGAALLLFVWGRGESLRYPVRTWLGFGLLGFLNNALAFVLIAYSEIHITSGVAAILNATTPLFTALVARAFASEMLTWNRMAGIFLGLAGVGVLMGRETFIGWDNADLLGELACLAAAVSYGFGGVYGRQFKDLPPLHVATGQTVSSIVLLLPFSLIFEQPWTLPMPGAAAWASLLGIALPSTAFAYVVYYRLLARAGATNVSLVTLLVPISALLFGALILGEEIAPTALAGMAIIAAGLAFIDGRLLRR